MKQVYLAFLFFFGISFTFGQISTELTRALEENPNELYDVCISFPSMVDYPSLNASFKSERFTSAQRSKVVNRLLILQAETFQKNALQIIKKQLGETHGYVYPFYIVNRIFAKLPKTSIQQLARLPEIQEITLTSGELIFDEPVQFSSSTNKSATGPEPGLIAINAPAMWNLGYTGRGRKVYIYDTGVWPTHPTFSNRFLGNFGPMQEAWYGHVFDGPTGVQNSHGTHVLGTTAGLDTATSDTIGVAFGAYWMACDLINGSTAAGLPDQIYLIGAFEWALNPDGDTSTTDDVPDVINNSWRWRDIIDTAECNGMIPQLMSAIEAAGIANVFSGGNTGPSNNGVNSPQRINTSEVNTFTVGSVNANQSFPYPISSFSTRGPTQCAGTGSLKIHPEVVAPGQDVRSAWGTNSYNTISGTSMASPHVSGALLLLKEAFPNLSGEILLEALYNSTIDLGPVGEDNTYGRGLIDVYAAYLLLAQTNTPINPNDVAWDISIKEVSYPGSETRICDSLFIPTVVVENVGDSTISAVYLHVFDNGVPTTPQPVLISTPNFSSGAVLPLNTNLTYPIQSGEHVWSFEVTMNKSEYDYTNNRRFVRFTKLNDGLLPLIEDFENGLDRSNWQLDNPDYSTTWDTVEVQGWLGNYTSLFLNAPIYLPNNSQKDGLITRQISLPQVGASANLAFDLAYQSRGSFSVLQDTLAVFLSDDCGKSFTQALYKKHGIDLATVANTGNLFVPADSSEWRREYISLSAFAGKDILLKFESTNRTGNPIYIDNISVYAGFDPLAIAENNKFKLRVYPNPANDMLNIELNNGHQSDFEIEMVDVNGRLIAREKINADKSQIDVSGFANGIYFISVKGNDVFERLKFVKL